jgi:hypothetical protein
MTTTSEAFVPNVTVRSSLHQAALILEALPAYIVCELVYDVERPTGITHRVMTRDMPRAGRRLTNLDTGMEMFVDVDRLEAAGVIEVRFPLLTIVTR